MKSQKEAVFTAVQTTLASMKIELKGPITALPNAKEVREAVSTLVVAGFKAGEVKLDTTFETDDALTSYTKGMVNNWFRKDIRLNGGEPYKAKNPGSRAGSGNEEVRELKKLRVAQAAAGATAETLAMIDGAIETKVSAHKLSKQPQPDLGKIDPALLAKIGIKVG